MTNRVTNKDLQLLVDQINLTKGCNTEPYSKDEGGNLKSNIGTYYIDSAYGGFQLVQIANESGGVTTVSQSGYGTKRELLSFLQGMLRGIEN